MTTKDKPFKVGETLVEWAGSFGRFPSSVRTVKKTFKQYIEDERGRKWRYDGFEHPMSNSSNKLERITDESLNEIRTWVTKRKINKIIDEVVRRVRRDELELEQLEAVLSVCLSLVSDEDRASVADDEEDDLVQLLAKHKPKSKPPQDVPLHAVLSWLKGQKFVNPRGVDAHDFIHKTAKQWAE